VTDPRDRAPVSDFEAFVREYQDMVFGSAVRLLGNPAEAVSLLHQSLEHDVERHFLHLDPDLWPLREYPPFRELMRFKG